MTLHMPSSTLFLVTFLGLVLGILLDGALGGLIVGTGAYLLLRVQQLSVRLRALEQASQAERQDKAIDDALPPP